MSFQSTSGFVQSSRAMDQLKTFLSFCSQPETFQVLDLSRNKVLREAIQNGFVVMQNLPVAKDAVFHQLSCIYDDLVGNFVNGSEGNDQEDAAELLSLISGSCTNLLEADAASWCPVISTWSLRLLGQLSGQYSGRGRLARGQTVNESIHMWMSCRAVKNLLELAAKCLHLSTNKDFISVLLDTSALHSPNFDWVVAHIGNSFPQTIVDEVLSIGLQNFASSTPQVSKLSSVVGILGHLATTHSKEIEFSFDRLLKEGINAASSTTEEYAILYLLQLCSSSVPLLDILMDTAVPKINDDSLQQLCNLVQHWVTLHFGGKAVAFMALVTHLLLKSTRGPKALRILLSGGARWPSEVQHHAKALLYHFVSEISSLIYRSDTVRKELGRAFPCVQALRDEFESFLPYLIDEDPSVAGIAQQIIKLIGSYDSKDVGVGAVCHYLCEARRDSHLWLMVDLVSVLSTKNPKILSECLKLILAKGETKEPRCWSTIRRLLKTKLPHRYSESFKLQDAISDNVYLLVPFLDPCRRHFDLKESHDVTDILCGILTQPRFVRFGTLLTVERHLIQLLFQTLSENGHKKIVAVSNIARLLNHLAANSAIQNDALRSLVQTSLAPENRHLLQLRAKQPVQIASEPVYNDEDFHVEKFGMYAPLMKDNKFRTASISSARVYSTSFLNGRLERSRAFQNGSSAKVQILENSDFKLNLRLLLGVVTTICMARDGEDQSETREVSVEATRQIALLLVQIVSPDVMFNGLPWPDEEFSKVQVERDIQIRRAFEEHPYLWDLLEFVGNYCPSLCYCSVLLRALMATLIAYWTTQQVKDCKAIISPSQLQWTVRLINVMKVGQLLPPPLGFIGEVLPRLKANEIVGLLKDVWSYMKNNVPVPSIFVRDSKTLKFMRALEFYNVEPIYSERLRLSVLNNVEDLGYVFPRFFPMEVKHNMLTMPLQVNVEEDGRPPQIQSPSPTKSLSGAIPAHVLIP